MWLAMDIIIGGTAAEVVPQNCYDEIANNFFKGDIIVLSKDL
jgi:hypothetical protein